MAYTKIAMPYFVYWMTSGLQRRELNDTTEEFWAFGSNPVLASIPGKLSFARSGSWSLSTAAKTAFRAFHTRDRASRTGHHAQLPKGPSPLLDGWLYQWQDRQPWIRGHGSWSWSLGVCSPQILALPNLSLWLI